MNLEQRVTVVEETLATTLPVIRQEAHDAVIEARGWAGVAIHARDLAAMACAEIKLVHQDLLVTSADVKVMKEVQAEHGVRLDAIDAKLVAHDRRFDAHDKRFDAIDRRLDEQSETLQQILAKVS